MKTYHRLARGLGWFSIGLGMAEILAPRALANLIGAPPRTGLIRTLGVREVLTGLGILAFPSRPHGGMWGRVAGDAVDLALLGAAMTSPRGNQGRLLGATAAVAGVTVVDAVCAKKLSEEAGITLGHVCAKESIRVNASPERCYQFLRNYENLAKFMSHIESVEELPGNRTRWVAKGPAGIRYEWTGETTVDEPNRRIAWRSLDGDGSNQGEVCFEPATGNRGTNVRLEMHYSPPGGVLGSAALWFLGREPSQLMKTELRRFKQLLETGEIATTQGQSAGAGRTQGLGKLDWFRT